MLLDWIKEKTNILENAEDFFISEIGKSEKSIFSSVLKILRRFRTSRGRIENDKTNIQLLNELNKAVREGVANSKYASRVERFLPKFDRIERLNRQIMEDLEGVDLRNFPLSAEKREAVEFISKNLTTAAAIDANVAAPIKKLLYNSIRTGGRYVDAENQLRLFIKGDENTRGYLKKYVTQISRDSINQFDGSVNQAFVDQFEMNAFRIIGSLVKGSRNTCTDMVNGTGRFADLLIGTRSYLIEDIPKIISFSKNNPGWNNLTTPETYFIYRNGFNCRHQFVGYRTENEDAIKKLDRIS